jgi:hypothetical protein
MVRHLLFAGRNIINIINDKHNKYIAARLLFRERFGRGDLRLAIADH